MKFPKASQQPGRLWATLCVAALMIAGAFPARAESDKAETLIRQALELRRAGNDQKACPLLHEAHELSPSPRAAAQLGFCAQAVGSWVEAEVYIEEALRAPGDPWVKKNRSAIEQALITIKSHIGRVEVTGEPTGAEVLVNGIAVGKLPLPERLPVAAGEIEIELHAPGYISVTKRLRVEGAQTHRIRLRAEKSRDPDRDRVQAAPSAVAAAPVGSGMNLAASNPGELAKSPGDSSTPEGSRETDSSHEALSSTGRRSLKFIGWGLAAVGLGIGVYGVVHNSKLVDEFDSGCGLDAKGVPHPTMLATAAFTEARCVTLKHDYEQASTMGIVGLVAGGVFATAGFVLWALEPSGRETQTAGWSCAPALLGRDRPQLTCALRF